MTDDLLTSNVTDHSLPTANKLVTDHNLSTANKVAWLIATYLQLSR